MSHIQNLRQLIFTLVSIMLTIYDEFYACIADAILSDVEEVQTIQQASQLALRDVNPRTRTLRELLLAARIQKYIPNFSI